MYKVYKVYKCPFSYVQCLQGFKVYKVSRWLSPYGTSTFKNVHFRMNKVYKVCHNFDLKGLWNKYHHNLAFLYNVILLSYKCPFPYYKVYKNYKCPFPYVQGLQELQMSISVCTYQKGKKAANKLQGLMSSKTW